MGVTRRNKPPNDPNSPAGQHLHLVKGKGNPDEPHDHQAALLEEEVGLLKMNEERVDAHEALRRVDRMLTDPGFELTLVSQVDAVRLLQRGQKGGVEFPRIKSALIEKLPVTPERFEFILKMPRRRDIRTALQYEHVVAEPRTKEEQLYPTEGWLGVYLQYAEVTEVPLAWHFWSGVATLGAAMRRNVYCNPGYFLYPNHYILLVGESAAGKGWSIERAAPILRDANDYLLEHLADYPGGVKDRRVKILPDKAGAEMLCQQMAPAAEPVSHPKARNTVLVDTDSIGAMFCDEVSTMLTKKSHNPALLIRLLTKFYNCADAWDEGAIYRGMNKLRDMALTFLSGSTVEWLNDGITDDLFSAGFMSRFLFVNRTYSHRFYAQGVPAPDPVQRDALARHLTPWMLCSDIELDRTDPKTMAIWADLRKRNRERVRHPDDVRMVPYYKRYENHILKLCMVLEASNRLGVEFEQLDAAGRIILQPETLELAIQIFDFEEAKLPECFERLGQTDDAKTLDILAMEIRSFNVSQGRAMKLGRELGPRVRKKVGAQWKQLVKELIELGTIRQARGNAEKGTPGRPGQVLWCPKAMGEEWVPGMPPPPKPEDPR